MHSREDEDVTYVQVVKAVSNTKIFEGFVVRPKANQHRKNPFKLMSLMP